MKTGAIYDMVRKYGDLTLIVVHHQLMKLMIQILRVLHVLMILA